MVDFAFVPERTALINVDMQNCFVHGTPFSSPDGLAVQERIYRVAAVCRPASILVIHSCHVLRPDGSNTGELGEISGTVKRGIINKGSVSAALHKELFVDPRDLLLDKLRFNAIDSIIITGIATNVCGETTARETAVRDFHVFFLSDVTVTFDIGDLSAAELQRVTCATLGRLFAQVLTVDEMINKISAGTQSTLATAERSASEIDVVEAVREEYTPTSALAARHTEENTCPKHSF